MLYLKTKFYHTWEMNLDDRPTNIKELIDRIEHAKQNPKTDKFFHTIFIIDDVKIPDVSKLNNDDIDRIITVGYTYIKDYDCINSEYVDCVRVGKNKNLEPFHYKESELPGYNYLWIPGYPGEQPMPGNYMLEKYSPDRTTLYDKPKNKSENKSKTDCIDPKIIVYSNDVNASKKRFEEIGMKDLDIRKGPMPEKLEENTISFFDDDVITDKKHDPISEMVINGRRTTIDVFYDKR